MWSVGQEGQRQYSHNTHSMYFVHLSIWREKKNPAAAYRSIETEREESFALDWEGEAMKKATVLLLAATLAVFMSARAEASINLVTNGGFEAGNLSGWTVHHAFLGSDVEVGSAHHSGRHAAEFGAWLFMDDAISQVIPTIAGKTYTFTFWLKHAATDYLNNFAAKWNGTEVLDLVGARKFGWTEYHFDMVATSASTTIAFCGAETPSWYYLDDVCVKPSCKPVVPEPSTMLVWTGLGAIGLVVARRRRKQAA
jgi:hypothetical protein